MAINEAVARIKNDEFPACHVSLMEGNSFNTLNNETTSRKRLAKFGESSILEDSFAFFVLQEQTAHQVAGVMMAT